MEQRRGDLLLADDLSRLDVARIHDWLCHEAYWALDRNREAVDESLRRSHVYGVWQDEQQIAVARVITDGVAFAYICDVFVAAGNRGQGIGSWLVDCIVADLREERVEQVLLATRDAHALYLGAGFHGLNRPERWLELNPTVDGTTMRSSR
jgi:predicted GNAT family acetyltransferase